MRTMDMNMRGIYGRRPQGAGTRCLKMMSTKNNKHSSFL